MNTITRAQLVALGGDQKARYAVFYPDGTLYFTTTAKEAEHVVVFQLGKHCPTKEVVD